MNPINDRIRAKRLLAARAHKFRISPFLRQEARRYFPHAFALAVLLLVLAFNSLWSAFGLLVSFLLGMLCVYLRWLRAQKSVWPFAMKVIDWDKVGQLAEDAPPPSREM